MEETRGTGSEFHCDWWTLTFRGRSCSCDRPTIDAARKNIALPADEAITMCADNGIVSAYVNARARLARPNAHTHCSCCPNQRNSNRRQWGELGIYNTRTAPNDDRRLRCRSRPRFPTAFASRHSGAIWSPIAFTGSALIGRTALGDAAARYGDNVVALKSWIAKTLKLWRVIQALATTPLATVPVSLR